MAGHFEAKKHGYRQTQDGVVVSFVLHPNDLDAAFAVAALGTRYMVAFAEIGDDEKPKPQVVTYDEAISLIDNKQHKPRRPFNDLKLSARAGIRCGDDQFSMFLMDVFPETAAKYTDPADVVRQLCGITSRAELDTDFAAATEWDHIERKYQDWLATKKYKDVYR